MNKWLWLQIGIGAAVTLLGAYLGVYLSFSKELRRAAEEERRQFGQMLRSVLVESANNIAILNNLKSYAVPGQPIWADVRAVALQAALASPVFYRLADHSLVLAVNIVMTRLATVGNILSQTRGGIADARELKIRADGCAETIRMMQDLLEKILPNFGATVVADSRLNEVQETMKEISRKEDEKLQGLRGPR